MHSNLKGFTVRFDYKPNEIVRVTIVIEENANKDDVIRLLSEKMKDETSFELHNTKLDDFTFTINIRYSLVDSLKEIEGIREVDITRSVGLHDETTTTAPSTNQNDILVHETNFFSETGPKIVALGILVVLVLVLLRKKVLKNK